MEEKKSIFEISPDTQLLIARLEKMQKGECVQYDELSKIIGRNVQMNRSSLLSARRILQRQGMVFDAVSGVGIKRLDDIGIVKASQGHVFRAYQAARRGAQKLSCVDYDTLNNEDKITHNTSASILGAIALVAKPSNTKKLLKAVQEARETLPTAKTLELFSK